MTTPTKRGRGRPPLAEGERPARLYVRLTAELREEIERARGDQPLAEWVREVLERAVKRERREG